MGCLQNILFYFWPKLSHPAARFLCDSWTTSSYCILYYVFSRGVREWLSCSHYLPTFIESFPFPPIPIPTLHSNSYFPITSIPIPHSYSHFRQGDYIETTLKPRNLYIVLWIQKKILSYSRSIVNQTHQSSVIIIITITAYHCSLFNVYQTVTACYCAKTAGCSHCRWEFYCSPIKYAIPIPINIPKRPPFPWESHGNGNSHSHAHLYSVHINIMK